MCSIWNSLLTCQVWKFLDLRKSMFWIFELRALKGIRFIGKLFELLTGLTPKEQSSPARRTNSSARVVLLSRYSDHAWRRSDHVAISTGSHCHVLAPVCRDRRRRPRACHAVYATLIRCLCELVLKLIIFLVKCPVRPCTGVCPSHGVVEWAPWRSAFVWMACRAQRVAIPPAPFGVVKRKMLESAAGCSTILSRLCF
jgi:hypothetical protein